MWLPLPAGVDFEQAGVALWPFSSSHRVVRDRLQRAPGDNVLITGASGGMGQATLQLAKLAGARVIATTRHDGKAATLRELGADAVVVTADADAARQGGVARSPAAKASITPWTTPAIRSCCAFHRQRDAARRHAGHHQRAGPRPLPFTAADMIRLELNLLGIRGARMNDMLTVLKLLGEGRIRTRIAARFPLAKVGEAHTLLETSPDLVGRIVVLPWG